jgi:hypothetical protein
MAGEPAPSGPSSVLGSRDPSRLGAWTDSGTMMSTITFIIG